MIRSKKDAMLYTGSTNDLRKRFDLHNSGKISSTKSRRPFEIIYYEAYRAEKDARIRESNLKLRSNAFFQLKRRLPESLKVWGHGKPPNKEEAREALAELRTLGQRIKSEHE